MIKLSVITINYNNKDGLRKTLESVALQTYQDFEYIVIDGGSTDGSIDVIKEYDKYIDFWASEPDNGIYHAMNKGTQHAHGEYCNYLNSGDYYYDNTVVQRFINCNHDSDVIVGKTAYVGNAGKVELGRSLTDEITFLTFYKRGINHQAAFIKTKYLQLFPYDEKYKIRSDWKFFIQSLLIENCSFSTIDNVIVYFDTGGISSTKFNESLQEREMILKEFNFPPRIRADYDMFSMFDLPLFELVKKLNKYNRFCKFICHLDMFIIKLYTFFQSLHSIIKRLLFCIVKKTIF